MGGLVQKTILVAVAGLLLTGSITSSRSRGAPEEWAPGVILGEGVLNKRVWADVSVGRVSEIRVRSKPTPGMPILVVGSNGVAFMARNGSIKKTILFDRSGGRVVAVDLDGDGQEEFLNRGGGWQPVSIYDSQGNTIWSYGARHIIDVLLLKGSPNDMAMGDVDGDGKLEFVVGLNGGGGVVLLNSLGQVMWREKDANVWGVEIIDLDGDGKKEIIHTDFAGNIKVRNKDGAIIKSIRPDVYVSRFSRCAWPHPNSSLKIIESDDKDNKFYLMDMLGNTVNKLSAPWAVFNDVQCSLVNFDGGKDYYFAVINLVKVSWRRAVLYIYNPKGDLIYEEVIPAAMATLSSMSSKAGKGASLFVGGEGVVWEYSLNK